MTPGPNDLPIHLTGRQVEVLESMAGGKTRAQAAEDLNITLSTVKNHLHVTHAQLGVYTNAHAIIKAAHYMETLDMTDEEKAAAEAAAKAKADAETAEGEAVAAKAKADADAAEVEEAAAKAKADAEAAGDGQHGAQFSFGGKEFGQSEFTQFMEDHKVLATKVAAFEATFAAQAENARVEFVDSLVESDKVFEKDREAELSFVKSLDPKQYSAYQERMGSAPVIGLLQTHLTGNQEDEGERTKQFAAQLDVDRETVKMFERGGTMSREAIEKSEPYIRLQAAAEKGKDVA